MPLLPFTSKGERSEPHCVGCFLRSLAGVDLILDRSIDEHSIIFGKFTLVASFQGHIATMKTPRSLLIAALALVTSAGLLHAEKNTALKPIIAKAGKVVAEDAFAGPELAKTWNIAKGDWQAKDGVLTGKEKASDNHPGVLILNKANKDSIIQFSFKLDGVKAFDLSFNTPKGHLFRVVIGKEGITLSKDKDKKDKASKSAMLAEANAAIEPGKWVTMLVEVKGDKVNVQTDNGLKLSGSHPELNVEKTGYRFVARGESVSISDLKIWQAE